MKKSLRERLFGPRDVRDSNAAALKKESVLAKINEPDPGAKPRARILQYHREGGRTGETPDSAKVGNAQPPGGDGDIRPPIGVIIRHGDTERGDELDVESYLFVTQIIEHRPSTLSSGLVHWTLVRTGDGYKVRAQHTVLDSIESAPFHQVAYVADRQTTW